VDVAGPLMLMSTPSSRRCAVFTERAFASTIDVLGTAVVPTHHSGRLNRWRLVPIITGSAA